MIGMGERSSSLASAGYKKRSAWGRFVVRRNNMVQTGQVRYPHLKYVTVKRTKIVDIPWPSWISRGYLTIGSTAVWSSLLLKLPIWVVWGMQGLELPKRYQSNNRRWLILIFQLRVWLWISEELVNGCSHPIHTEKHRFRPIPSLNLPLFSMQGMWFWRFLPNLWAWFTTGTTGQGFSWNLCRSSSIQFLDYLAIARSQPEERRKGCCGIWPISIWSQEVLPFRATLCCRKWVAWSGKVIQWDFSKTCYFATQKFS